MQVGPQDEPSPSNINFLLQHEPPPSNINHPLTKNVNRRSNMGVAQEIVQSLTSRTRNDRLSDKILTKMSCQYFFNEF